MRAVYAVSEVGLEQCKELLSSIRSWPNEAHRRKSVVVAGPDSKQDVDDVEGAEVGELL